MATEILQHKTQRGKKAGKKWTEHQLAVGQIPATWGMCDEVTKEDEERQEICLKKQQLKKIPNLIKTTNSQTKEM